MRLSSNFTWSSLPWFYTACVFNLSLADCVRKILTRSFPPLILQRTFLLILSAAILMSQNLTEFLAWLFWFLTEYLSSFLISSLYMCKSQAKSLICHFLLYFSLQRGPWRIPQTSVPAFGTIHFPKVSISFLVALDIFKSSFLSSRLYPHHSHSFQASFPWAPVPILVTLDISESLFLELKSILELKSQYLPLQISSWA